MRGAQQIGMPREVFNPKAYLEVRGQSVREVHASCYDVLQILVVKVTGKSMFASYSTESLDFVASQWQ